jgi:hypothetical protein
VHSRPVRSMPLHAPFQRSHPITPHAQRRLPCVGALHCDSTQRQGLTNSTEQALGSCLVWCLIPEWRARRARHCGVAAQGRRVMGDFPEGTDCITVFVCTVQYIIQRSILRNE